MDIFLIYVVGAIVALNMKTQTIDDEAFERYEPLQYLVEVARCMFFSWLSVLFFVVIWIIDKIKNREE